MSDCIMGAAVSFSFVWSCLWLAAGLLLLTGDHATNRPKDWTKHFLEPFTAVCWSFTILHLLYRLHQYELAAMWNLFLWVMP